MTTAKKQNPFSVLKTDLVAAARPRNAQDDTVSAASPEPISSHVDQEPESPVSRSPYLVEAPVSEAPQASIGDAPTTAPDADLESHGEATLPRTPEAAEPTQPAQTKPKKEPTNQISLHIPQSLYRRWRIGLTATGKTGTEVIESFIETWLKDHQDEIRAWMGQTT
jgi:hypothetical protein